MVNVDLELRYVTQAIRAHALQNWILRCHAEDLITCIHQCFMPTARAVNKLEVKT